MWSLRVLEGASHAYALRERGRATIGLTWGKWKSLRTIVATNSRLDTTLRRAACEIHVEGCTNHREGFMSSSYTGDILDYRDDR